MPDQETITFNFDTRSMLTALRELNAAYTGTLTSIDQGNKKTTRAIEAEWHDTFDKMARDLIALHRQVR